MGCPLAALLQDPKFDPFGATAAQRSRTLKMINVDSLNKLLELFGLRISMKYVRFGTLSRPELAASFFSPLLHETDDISPDFVNTQ
jgi:hypothetical protein